MSQFNPEDSEDRHTQERKVKENNIISGSKQLLKRLEHTKSSNEQSNNDLIYIDNYNYGESLNEFEGMSDYQNKQFRNIDLPDDKISYRGSELNKTYDEIGETGDVPKKYIDSN